MASLNAVITGSATTLLTARAPEDPIRSALSEAMSIGSSIVSQVLSEDGPAPTRSPTSLGPSVVTSVKTVTTSDPRPTQSGKPSNSRTSTRSKTSASSTSTTSIPTSHPSGQLKASDSSSGNNSNSDLPIILGAVIATLVVILVGFSIWIFRRRRRRQAKSKDRFNSLESSDSGEMQTSESAVQPLMRQYDIPAPSTVLLESSRGRSTTAFRSPTDSSSTDNPFLTPPFSPDDVGPALSRAHYGSSEADSGLREPTLPKFLTKPVEIDGKGVPGIPRRSSRRQTVHYPSAAEISRFDFGLNKQKPANPSNKRRPSSYSIPRKPVGG